MKIVELKHAMLGVSSLPDVLSSSRTVRWSRLLIEIARGDGCDTRSKYSLFSGIPNPSWCVVA